MKLLIIEDEKITRITLANTLRGEGFEVFTAEDGEEGLDIFRKELPDIVITDLRLPKTGGLEILEEIIRTMPDCKVVLITAYATVETAVKALKMGAYDYLTKPFSPEELLSILRNIRQLHFVIKENRELRQRIKQLENRTLIGNSAPVKKLRDVINHIANNDASVLIEGESGTGKELVARMIHLSGNRGKEKFVAVSCSSIPETLLESELFGHEKGAFTGAAKRHIGYFESADKGTLFIDDVDDIPLQLQVKLLRVLQEHTVIRVGGTEPVPFDVRVIAASKTDLRAKADLKEFREDLYYRLNIVTLKVPPLRQRKEDIPELIEHFFRKYDAADKLAVINDQLLSSLLAHEWPGNVRELENICQRIIVLSNLGSIDPALLDFSSPHALPKPNISFNGSFPSLEEYMEMTEKEVIEQALRQSGNNITRAARLLQIPRTTLNSKLKQL
ncbi:MAG: sigma-54 dependent transcriptional regulator [Ignavibacteriaceae bacterium]|nr:sigma-54 dependent transcriptional regulator [Ignavibacteriaceae bacterium]